MDPVGFWSYTLAEIALMFDGYLMRTNPKAYKARQRRKPGTRADMEQEFEAMVADFGLPEEGE